MEVVAELAGNFAVAFVAVAFVVVAFVAVAFVVVAFVAVAVAAMAFVAMAVVGFARKHRSGHVEERWSQRDLATVGPETMRMKAAALALIVGKPVEELYPLSFSSVTECRGVEKGVLLSVLSKFGRYKRYLQGALYQEEGKEEHWIDSELYSGH